MLIERHPSLVDLTTEEKLQLHEELWIEAVMEARLDPSLHERVAQRLKDLQDHPDTAFSWDELNSRILSGETIAR